MKTLLSVWTLKATGLLFLVNLFAVPLNLRAQDGAEFAPKTAHAVTVWEKVRGGALGQVKEIALKRVVSPPPPNGSWFLDDRLSGGVLRPACRPFSRLSILFCQATKIPQPLLGRH